MKKNNFKNLIKRTIANNLSSKFSSNIFRGQLIDPNKSNLIVPEYLFNIDKDSIKFDPSCMSSDSINKGKWGGANPVFYNYESSYLDSLSREVRVFNGSSDVKIFEDVIYSPYYHCLYSSDGIRINDSCLYRGINRKLITQAPDQIKIPNKLKTFSGEFIYGGSFLDGYGHFLTESIARLWYAFHDERYCIVCHGLRERYKLKPNFMDIFFERIKLDKRRFISFNKTVLLRKILIPYPSFINSCEAYDIHKLIPENLAKNLIYGRKQASTKQPLYLSRRLLKSNMRLITNEDKLEIKLQEKGWEICYLEKLNLQQQIYLINKHEVIVGTIGSALHNILFDLSPNRDMVCFSYKDSINKNYLMIDAIKNYNSVYIAALEEDDINLNKKYTFIKRKLDLNVAIEVLENMDLL